VANQKINPQDMYDSVQYGFSHAVAHRGKKTIELAGQVAWDADCNLVGEGDLAAQAKQVFQNLRQVLAVAGAGPADVVRLRTYIVDYTPDMLDVIGSEIAAFYDGAVPAANTLIGVQSLALPGFMIEVEAVAVVD